MDISFMSVKSIPRHSGLEELLTLDESIQSDALFGTSGRTFWSPSSIRGLPGVVLQGRVAPAPARGCGGHACSAALKASPGSS